MDTQCPRGSSTILHKKCRKGCTTPTQQYPKVAFFSFNVPHSLISLSLSPFLCSSSPLGRPFIPQIVEFFALQQIRMDKAATEEKGRKAALETAPMETRKRPAPEEDISDTKRPRMEEGVAVPTVAPLLAGFDFT